MVFLSSESYSQVNQNQSSNSQVIGTNLNPSSSLIAQKPFEKGIEGSPFLLEDWADGRVYLNDGKKMFETQKLNYNVRDDRLKVLVGEGFVDIFGSNVNSFVIREGQNERKFVSSSEYNLDNNSKEKGFFEVLYEGEACQLVEHHYIYLKRATYNQALMVGEENDKIMVKSNFFYVNNEGNVSELRKFKDLKKIVGSDIATKKISMNKEELMSFFISKEL